MSPQTIIFVGPGGSGKGTQARLLFDYLQKKDPTQKVLSVETGELFRDFITKKNYTGLLASQIINKGELLPDFMAIWVWAEFLVEHFSGKEHIIFDGVARDLFQAQAFDEIIRFYRFPKPIVIEIKVSEAWSMARLLERGRHDDIAEKIKNRLLWYYHETVKSLDFFRNNPYYHCITINGEQGKEIVHEEIIKKLEI